MISVATSRDMTLFNWMINHPEIAPHVRDDATPGPMDLSPLNTYGNIMLRVDFNGQAVGFAVMLAKGQGTYEQHSGIMEAYRGHNALRAGREALRWMFLNTDCETMSTWAWSCAKHVAMMARAVGFIEEARTKWPATVNSQAVDRVTYTQTLIEWSRKAKDDFVEDSHRMNLGAEPVMMGFDAIFARIALTSHFDKAQRFYNRWAAIFGAQPIQIVGFRAGNIVVCLGGRVIEISPDLSTSLIQGDLCPSQQQSRT